MMDWGAVGSGGLWVAGLALLLATLSGAGWLAGRRREPLRTVLAAPAGQVALAGALLLVSGGLALSNGRPWERAVCALVALLAAGLALRAGRAATPRAGTEYRPSGADEPAVPRPGDDFVVPPSGVFARLSRLELWWALAALPFLIFPGPLSPWAVAALALLWIARRLSTGHWTTRTPVDGSLLALILVLPLSAWASADRAATVVALYRLLGGLALCYALVNWAGSWRRLALCGALWVLTGAGLAALGLLAAPAWGLPGPVPAWLQSHGRALVAEDVNANVLAGSLAIVWPVPAALLFGSRGRPAVRSVRMRLGLAACLAGTAVVLLLTRSRGAWLAVAGAAGVMALLRWPRGVREMQQRPRLRPVLPVVGLALLLWLARGSNGPLQRLADLTSGGAVTTLSGRQEVWARAIAMVEDFPFTGIGPGAFDRVQPLLYPFFLVSGPVHHAHNLFLQVAVDLGLPGLVAWLAVLLGAFYATWRVWQKTRLLQENGLLNSLALGLLGGQVALWVHGLLDAVLWGNRLAILPWFLLGLSLATVRLASRDWSDCRHS